MASEPHEQQRQWTWKSSLLVVTSGNVVLLGQVKDMTIHGCKRHERRAGVRIGMGEERELASRASAVKSGRDNGVTRLELVEARDGAIREDDGRCRREAGIVTGWRGRWGRYRACSVPVAVSSVSSGSLRGGWCQSCGVRDSIESEV